MTGSLESDLNKLIDSARPNYNPDLMLAKKTGITTNKTLTNFAKNNPDMVINEFKTQKWEYPYVTYDLMPSGYIRKITHYKDTYNVFGNLTAKHEFLTKKQYEKEIKNDDASPVSPATEVSSRRQSTNSIINDFSKYVNLNKKKIKNFIFDKSEKPLKLTNTNDLQNVNLSKNSVDKMISTVYKNAITQAKRLGLSKTERQTILNDGFDIIANIKEFYPNAIPILSHGDLNGVKGRTITRYALPVNANGNKYNVMLTVKNGEVEDIGILYDMKTGNRSNGTSVSDLTNFVNEELSKYTPDEAYYNSVSPLDLQKIKEQVGHSINWQDETARNYKNPVLEQLILSHPELRIPLLYTGTNMILNSEE